jgi:CheY-like chemotaxis protein/methyl-accepting chemotaxis protein
MALQFKSIMSRLVFLFFMVAFIPLIPVSGIIYQQRVTDIKQREFNKLVAIRDLKAEQLTTWLDERLGDIRIIAGDAQVKQLLDRLKKPEVNREEPVFDEVRGFLIRYIQNYDSFNEVFLISSSGKIEVSSNAFYEGEDRSDELYFTEPMRIRDAYIRDIYYSKRLNIPSMTLSCPVYSIRDPDQIAGVAVVRINLERSLYDILLQRTGLGKTGETLIVNKEVVALNQLRWHENAPLKLKITASPAVDASKGQTGIIESLDYRGHAVLAAFTSIPKTGWGFVAKQDLGEIYAPIYTMLRQLITIMVLISFVIFFIAFFTARAIARPVLEMTAAAGKIRSGDLTARNTIKRSDEFGFLGMVFNEMTAAISSQITIQQGASHITDVMVACKRLNDFSGMILIKIMEITRSDLGVLYIRHEDENRFEPVSSVGADKSLLQSFDGDALEGHMGAALASGKISRNRDIHEDTVFTFKTFAGTAIPREIITIPVLVNEQAAAVISLAALRDYSAESIEIINRVWPGLNTAFSNLMAGEKTVRMAEELQGKNQELSLINEELHSQSQELKEQTRSLKEQAEELEAQRLQLEAADRLKSEFLSNMSHELRTPLNSILALSRLMIARGVGKKPEEDAGFIKVVERNGQRLLNLINDILDLAKIESGRMDVMLSDFDPRKPVENALETIQPLAESRGLDIGVHIEDVPHMRSDMNKVQQVLINLVSNAVKFTPEGRIDISVTASDEWMFFEVRDTGIGIAESDLSSIFEEFRQADGSTTRPFEGTGLGLAISKRFAELLGGEIRVQSQIGRGSAFTLVLPGRYKTVKSPEEGPDIRPAPIPRMMDALKRTILIIDDEPEVQKMLKSYLEEAGYAVAAAHSGREGVLLAREIRPFAIILDIFMPEMDGWEVLRRLKSFEETSDIPVLIVSVSSDRETGAALGAAGYLMKPVQPHHLLAEIKKIPVGRDVHRILVVDDDPVIRLTLESILNGQGYSVIHADSGEEAIRLAKEARPDAAILDLVMPGMDGFETLERLKSSPQTCDIPVIILTARDLALEDRSKLAGSVNRIIEKRSMEKDRLRHDIVSALADIGRQTKFSSGRPRILVIEDNEVAAIQIKYALEESGFMVSVAVNGADGLESVIQSVPDAVILDLMMPGIDGFQVLEKIRSTRWTEDLPVLVLTAKELTEKERACLRQGNVRELIQKGSLNKEQILASVKALVEKQDREPPPFKDPVPGAGKLHKPILVVEDNHDNMFTILSILKETEYECIKAGDGEKAVRMAKAFQPGLILMDIQLPVLSGLDAAKQIKSDPVLNPIPIVALTAKAMKGDREILLSAGCDDYLPKPLNPDEVLNTVRKWMKS